MVLSLCFLIFQKRSLLTRVYFNCVRKSCVVRKRQMGFSVYDTAVTTRVTFDRTLLREDRMRKERKRLVNRIVTKDTGATINPCPRRTTMQFR